MKKERIISIIFGMGLVIFCILIFLKWTVPISDEVFNKKWYNYNKNTGVYRIFEISGNEMNLFGFEALDKCSKYKYNERNQIIKLDCDKKIKYIPTNDGTLLLKYEDEEIHFYETPSESYNYEFNEYYGVSEGEFIEQNSHIMSLRKINFNDFVSYYNSSKSLVVMIGDKCINTECYIFNKVIEKYISQSASVYTFDPSSLTNAEVNRLSEMNDEFSRDMSFYNNEYPKVIMFDNGEVTKIVTVRCDGLNCSKHNDLINDFK